MIRRAPSCVAACLLALAPTAIAADPKLPSDAEIRALLVGKWVQQKKGPGGAVAKGSTTFKKDGTFAGEATITVNGQTITVTVSGTWKVVNGTLIETIEKSNVPTLSKGQVSKDKVLAISRKALKLKTEDGQESEQTRAGD
jgi:hypothetical protein